MRKIPEKLRGEPPAIPAPKPAPGLCEDVLKLKLATPMVGGGVKAGDVDRDRPIRASSIRGHLRYWWRLLCANGLKGDRLREAEGAIWGSTETPSKVTVRVEYGDGRAACGNVPLRRFDATANGKKTPFGFVANGPEAYALFAANSNGQNIAQEGLVFTVTLTYPEEARDQVRMALAAWIYFGGVGARTRRGCGSLDCESGGEKLPSLKKILAANDQIALWRGNRANSGLDAWKEALKLYRDYRQEFRGEKHDKILPSGKVLKNIPGRSKWPEPDSLRELTGCALPKHSQPVIKDKSLIPSFPRAALGLPIIFHFADGGNGPKDRNRDPYQVTLTPVWDGQERQRMSSPVITKALYDRDKGEWYPAVIILPYGEALKIQPKTDIQGHAGKGKLPGVQSESYKTLEPMKGSKNAIEGFEKYIARNHFTKEGSRA